MKYLLLSAAVSLIATSSYAADAVIVEDVAVITPDTFTWTGGYIGLNAGYAWNNGKGIDDPTYFLRDYVGTYENGWFGEESNSNSNSFTGGIQAGYNYQINNLVLGIETDFNYIGLKKEYTAITEQSLYADPDYEYHLDEDLHMKTKIEWFGTIRPRLGFTPSDRLLVYATGGVAYGKVKSSGGYNWREHGFWWGGPGDHFFDRNGGFDGSSSKVKLGWTIGAGAEYALTQNISIKGEYLFVDLGKKSHIAYSTEEDGEYATWNDRAKFSTVRLGVNYKF
ncbi:outer membrane protein [Brucella gallinifaecis]|uniref:outer membrane protein n=1 Tax=Brucella gallinifaecis TaxID=215590 RepID=UPI0023605DD2|nr:outer membrane protein [Brucella gallinifaecis]